MALPREELKAKGLTDEQIESVIKMHSDTVNALKAQITAATVNKDDFDKLKAENENLKTQLSESKQAAADAEKYKKDYESVKNEYDTFKSDVETKAAKAEADKAFTKWLTDNGYTDKGANKIVKYGGFTPEFNKDGTIKNADKLNESVAAEWSEYKITAKTEGAKTETPPANTGGSKRTKAEIVAIKDPVERQQAIKENPEVFEIS